MLREKLNQRRVRLAVVRLGAEVDCELARGGFDDFLLRRARFNHDSILSHITIIPGTLNRCVMRHSFNSAHVNVRRRTRKF